MARRKQYIFLENGSATSGDIDFDGGNAVFFADGTFGGATLTLQIKSPNGTYMTVGANTTLTAAGCAGFICCAGALRVLVSGGTPSGLYCYVVGIPQNVGG